HTG
ncbi:helix-turn-helix family protein, partial [Vibrio parahaemolyticus EKP-008]